MVSIDFSGFFVRHYQRVTHFFQAMAIQAAPRRRNELFALLGGGLGVLNVQICSQRKIHVVSFGYKYIYIYIQIILYVYIIIYIYVVYVIIYIYINI